MLSTDKSLQGIIFFSDFRGKNVAIKRAAILANLISVSLCFLCFILDVFLLLLTSFSVPPGALTERELIGRPAGCRICLSF